MALSLIATCALGLEEFLAAELGELGASGIRRGRGAVAFSGGWEDCWRANWRLRTANRVLVELGGWNGSDGEALAAGAEALVLRRDLGWDGVAAGALFDPRRTLALRASASASRLRDTRWVALKVKDGLVDGQRRRFGRRSSVRRKSPDLPLRVWLSRDRATLLLDTSGESLDHRGYRVATVEAPVREQLAAACVLAAEWDGRGPVVDPMCGSGTLLAEAASFALGRAPGVFRRGWACERLPGFDRARWEAIRNEAIEAPGPRVKLYGIDSSLDAIRAARANLGKAGLGGHAILKRHDAFDYEPPRGPGLFLVNPAYGERLEEEPGQWRRLGDLLKKRYTGWRAVVLAGGETRGKSIGLRPKRRIPVKNGPLEARILVFDLY